MNENICNNFFELLVIISKHIKEHNVAIQCYDNPQRLLVGWGCAQTNTAFVLKLNTIRLRKAFPTIPYISKDTIEILEKFICASDGRDKIASFINAISGRDNIFIGLENMIKLKAFW